MLEQMFPGLNFDGSIVQPRRILESEVVLDIPEKTSDREIVPSRLPTAVSSRLVTNISYDATFSLPTDLPERSGSPSSDSRLQVLINVSTDDKTSCFSY